MVMTPIWDPSCLIRPFLSLALGMIRSSCNLNFEEPDQTRCILDASPFEDNDIHNTSCSRMYSSQEFATRRLLRLIDSCYLSSYLSCCLLTFTTDIQFMERVDDRSLSRHIFRKFRSDTRQSRLAPHLALVYITTYLGVIAAESRTTIRSSIRTELFLLGT